MTVIRTTPQRAGVLKDGIDFLKNYKGQLINNIATGSPVENRPSIPGGAVRALLSGDLRQNGTVRANLLQWNEFSCNFVMTISSQLQFGHLNDEAGITLVLKMSQRGETIFETPVFLPVSNTGGITLTASAIYNAIIGTGKVAEDQLEIYTSYNRLIDGVLESVNYHLNFSGPFRDNPGIILEAIQRPNIWYKLTVAVPDIARTWYSNWYYIALRDIPALAGYHDDIAKGDQVFPYIYSYNSHYYGYLPSSNYYPWRNYIQNGWIALRNGIYGETFDDPETSFLQLQMRNRDNEELFTTDKIRLLDNAYVMNLSKTVLLDAFKSIGMDTDLDENGVDVAVITDTEALYYKSWWICFAGDVFGQETNGVTLAVLNNANNCQLIRVARPWIVSIYKSKDVITNDIITVHDVLRATTDPIPAASVVVAVPFSDIEYGVIAASSRFSEDKTDVYPYYSDRYYYGNSALFGWGYGVGVPFPYYPGYPYFGFNNPYYGGNPAPIL